MNPITKSFMDELNTGHPKSAVSKTLSLEDLKAMFSTAEQQARDGVRLMVRVVQCCLENEYPTDWINNAQRRWLVAIASEQLLLEAYERFQGTAVMPYLAKMPKHIQKMLADGGTVPVVVFRDGKTESRKADPLTLTRFEIQQVMNSGEIRDEAQQVSWLDTQTKKAAPIPMNSKQPWKINQRDSVVVIGNARLTRRDVMAILEELTA